MKRRGTRRGRYHQPGDVNMSDDLKERTEASVAKLKERSEELRDELGDARAATKVQIKAMVERLDNKYEVAKERLDALNRSRSETQQDWKELYDEVVADLKSMGKTIRRRIR